MWAPGHLYHYSKRHFCQHQYSLPQILCQVHLMNWWQATARHTEQYCIDNFQFQTFTSVLVLSPNAHGEPAHAVLQLHGEPHQETENDEQYIQKRQEKECLNRCFWAGLSCSLPHKCSCWQKTTWEEGKDCTSSDTTAKKFHTKLCCQHHLTTNTCRPLSLTKSVSP